MKNMRNWIEIAIFLGIVVADANGWVPISQTIFLVPFVWVALRLRIESWSAIGFSLPSGVLKLFAFGAIAGVLMELFAAYVTTPSISNFFGVEPDYSALNSIQGNLGLLFLFVTLSWFLAAFGEEICFRGFLMKRLAQVFGESRWAWFLSLVASSILFGWGHTEQGISGWLQEGISGFLLGVLFLVSCRNLVVPIVAHGVSNTLALALIYFGRYPGLS